MDPDTVLRALRALTRRVDEVYADPDANWSAELIEALEGIEALDGWLERGGAFPAAWTARR